MKLIDADKLKYDAETCIETTDSFKELIDQQEEINIDSIRREFYSLISQRDICSSIEATGRIVLEYDSKKVNDRIRELGPVIYSFTNGREGFKENIKDE